MSSSITLEPAKTASEQQFSSTQPSSTSTAETPQLNDETHTETSWKFLSQVLEEQDILTGKSLLIVVHTCVPHFRINNLFPEKLILRGLKQKAQY
jgi:hypothetical protein